MEEVQKRVFVEEILRKGQRVKFHVIGKDEIQVDMGIVEFIIPK